MLITVYLTFFSFSAVFAADGIISGKITDSKNGEPLFGVNVIIRGTFLGSSTNSKGNFEIKNVPPGNYEVMVTMIGYKEVSILNVRVIPDSDTPLNVSLTTAVLDIGENVIVTAERLLIEKDISSSIHYVSGEDIKNQPIDTFKEAVALQPGVTSDGHIRGGRETEVLYLIDGVPIRESIGGELAMELPPSSITNLSVQTGGFDVEYSNAMSGVVNIGTRSGSRKFVLEAKYQNDAIGGNETDNLRDTEVSIGGPLLNEKLRYYSALHYQTSNTRWGETLDTLRAKAPYVNYNFLGKLDYLFSPTLRLTFQGMISDWDQLNYEHRWRKNLSGLQTTARHSERFDITLTHNISKYTLYKIKFSNLRVESLQQPEGSPDDINPNQDIYQYDILLRWIIRGKRLWWQESIDDKNYLKAYLTTRRFEYHELKIGVEGNWHNIKNDNTLYEPQVNFWGKPLLDKPLLNFSTKYNYKPFIGAVYVQDRVKLGTANVNLGLRYDIFDPKAKRPKVEFTDPSLVDSLGVRYVTEYVDASVKSQLSPRIGFSVPATDKDLLFFNYGFFFQIPLFDYLYTGLDRDFRKGVNPLIGDPDLKNEETVSYEIGLKHLLTNSLLISATFFNKDIFNLIDTKTFISSDSKSEEDGFSQYVNVAFANTRGWELVLKKAAVAHFSSQISYTYMVAKGTSSSADQGYNYVNWGFEIPAEEYFLSWDQRHSVTASFGFDVVRKWNLNVIFRSSSARPYTYFPSKDGFTPVGTRLVPNNRRLKIISTLDLRISRTISLGRTKFFLFFDGRNLFDRNNLLWVDSSGKAGGELIDPAAWDVERRMRIGISVKL